VVSHEAAVSAGKAAAAASLTTLYCRREFGQGNVVVEMEIWVMSEKGRGEWFYRSTEVL